MTPAKINSILALATPMVLAAVSAFSPQIQSVLAHNDWITPVATFVALLWNNVAAPVHKA